VPRSKRLLTDDRSNIFVYMTGHGGDEFLKFQDNEEISAFDLADAFEQMWQKKRCVKVVVFVLEFEYKSQNNSYPTGITNYSS
jgi:phosphatidylinositol glycan class K